MNLVELSQRLKQVRLDRGLSLEEVARASGQTRSWLSKVENFRITPSLEALSRLAQTLEVPLSQLLEGLDVKPKMVKTAPAERSEVRRDEQCSTIRYFSLSREFLNRQMDPFILEVMPGEGRAEGKCHPGEEFLMVTRGALSLFYGEEEVPLKQGDSIYFNSMVPHRLWNAGSEPAEVLCVFLLRDDGRSW